MSTGSPARSQDRAAKTNVEYNDRSRLETLLALGLPSLLFLVTVNTSGIWEPFELRVAEMARRVAINAFGASSLVTQGADNTMPTLGDLGHNELPITSIAVGFKLFGLHAWAGRLPLALWACLGVFLLWQWMSQAISRRVATYASLILASCPLYFLQGRTMLGDIVIMTALIASFAGLSMVVLNQGKNHIYWSFIAALGLVAGYMSRGLLLGVAAPAATVGIVWAICRQHEGEKAFSSRQSVVGIATLFLGVVTGVMGLVAYFKATPSTYEMNLGAIALETKKWPTFDLMIQYVGHAAFPWSALLPLAIGRLFTDVETKIEENSSKIPEHRIRMLVLLGSIILVGLYTWIAGKVGALPYGGVGLLAVMVGLVLYDYERGAHPSRALAASAALFVALLTLDLQRIPEKVFVAYGITTGGFPDSIKPFHTVLLAVSAGVIVLGLLLAFVDGDDAPVPEVEDDYPKWVPIPEFLRIIEELKNVWGGNLAFMAVMVEAAMVGIGLLVFLGERTPLKILSLQTSFSTVARAFMLNGWWMIPAFLVATLFLVLLVRNGATLLLQRWSMSRAKLGLAGGTIAGVVLSVGYYPALASQLSPKEVFESYDKMRAEGEPLALLGISERAAAYHTNTKAIYFAEPTTSFSWLTTGDERRWMALRADDLKRVNALYRTLVASSGQDYGDGNIPVLDARSSQILLVSDRFNPGEKLQNPLSEYVTSIPPKPKYQVDVNLADQLQTLGWTLFDSTGENPVDFAVAGKKYVLALYYKVLAPIATDWEVFIHIDGYGRRYNGDHKLTKYPMTLWQTGDYVIDRYELQLEPNFTPGNYNLLYGFFLGDTRLSVRYNDRVKDNRVPAGTFAVR